MRLRPVNISAFAEFLAMLTKTISKTNSLRYVYDYFLTSYCKIMCKKINNNFCQNNHTLTVVVNWNLCSKEKNVKLCMCEASVKAQDRDRSLDC